jgi:hypothetical protein
MNKIAKKYSFKILNKNKLELKPNKRPYFDILFTSINGNYIIDRCNLILLDFNFEFFYIINHNYKYKIHNYY